MVNNNDFALGSCVWSGSQSRARGIARQLDAGMSAINDLGGTTYMSQSLPFGGCKRSGFDRFAGPEGLRGLCYPHVYSEDWVPWMKTALPPLLQYPATGKGFDFASHLISMTYGSQLGAQVLPVPLPLPAAAGGRQRCKRTPALMLTLTPLLPATPPHHAHSSPARRRHPPAEGAWPPRDPLARHFPAQAAHEEEPVRKPRE